MNARTTEPHWLAIVQQCEAQYGEIAGLPSLAQEIGPGCYFVRCYPETAHGLQRHVLYWIAGSSSNPSARKYHQIGSFALTTAETRKPMPRVTRTGGELTEGFDEQGRRLIRVVTEAHSKQTNLFAVEWETHRGVRLPRPVPVEMIR